MISAQYIRMNIDISNKTKKRIRRYFVQKVAEKTLGKAKKKPGNFSVSVVFVEKSEIQRLNRVYRKKNKVTDVLSFNYTSGYNKGGEMPEGELALCPEIIAKHARDNKVAFQKELAFVLSHGILHLLGFRHGRKMFEIQEEISSLKL